MVVVVVVVVVVVIPPVVVMVVVVVVVVVEAAIFASAMHFSLMVSKTIYHIPHNNTIRNWPHQ